eukprot:6582287-Ditylum_brightwellii.AAC.1
MDSRALLHCTHQKHRYVWASKTKLGPSGTQIKSLYTMPGVEWDSFIDATYTQALPYTMPTKVVVTAKMASCMKFLFWVTLIGTILHVSSEKEPVYTVLLPNGSIEQHPEHKLLADPVANPSFSSTMPSW